MVPLPYSLFPSTTVPSTMLGFSAKYRLIGSPSSISPIEIQISFSGSGTLCSFFCKKIISVVTSVPALLLNAPFLPPGKRIAPIKSAFSANAFLVDSSRLSSVPADVTNATIPPSFTLSSVSEKK